MVMVKKTGEIKGGMTSKKKLLTTTMLGVIFLLVPFIFLFFDPILFFAEYKLRMDNGSMLHEILSKELKGPKIVVYLFNISNAKEFNAGVDQKMKLEEVGPFVYQEYRIHSDLEINHEPGIMRFTPKLRTEFIPEESAGDPNDVQLVMLNIPLLLAVLMMSKQSYFIQQIFSLYASSLNSKAFVKTTPHKYLWGYPDPMIHLANSVVPGLIYFNTTGLLERFYDKAADYRLELGTTDEDKFSVKKATRVLADKTHMDIADSTQYFTDTYEGAAYPPNMSPTMPIHIYRHSFCKTYHMEYQGTRDMFYNGQSFVYHMHNETFNDLELCDSTGWCPAGLMNIAPCILGLPFAISKGHFLDSDPRLVTMFEGIKPDRSKHDIETYVDPKVGVSIGGSISIQLSLFLNSVAYYPATRKLKDLVLPLSHLQIVHPPMLEEVQYSLNLMYTKGPNILLACNIVCIILGLVLIAYSAKLMYYNWLTKNTIDIDKTIICKQTQIPLLVNKI